MITTNQNKVAGTGSRKRSKFRGHASKAPLEVRLRRRRPLHLILWFLLAIGTLLASVYLGPPSRSVMAWIALVIYVLGIFSLARCTWTGFWSPVTLFLVVVGVFHYGLIVNILSGIDPDFPRAADYIWYNGPVGVYATHLTTLGVVAYVFVSLLVLGMVGQKKRPIYADERLSGADDELAYRLSRAGSWLLLISTALWFISAISSVGLAGLFGSYQDFLAATRPTNLNLTYMGIGVGLGLTVMTRAKNLAVPALVLFALFAVIGFFLGLRGEVLFPMAVAASVLAQRRSMPNVPVVLFGLVALLALIATAKQIRATGLSASGLNTVDGSPVAALTELGSTLRVVATVVQWHEAGDPFRLGDTYTVSIARAAEQVTLGAQRLPVYEDMRLFNVEILNRAGGIGGSVIGEAYHNLAEVGVVVIMAIIAIIMVAFSRGYGTASRMAIYIVVAVPLFNHIRNSFVPVVPAIVFGLIFVLVVIHVARKRIADSQQRETKAEGVAR
ncbi:O-antigen polysaccharide polymerase Wzy [Yaniella flava]